MSNNLDIKDIIPQWEFNAEGGGDSMSSYEIEYEPNIKGFSLSDKQRERLNSELLSVIENETRMGSGWYNDEGGSISLIVDNIKKQATATGTFYTIENCDEVEETIVFGKEELDEFDCGFSQIFDFMKNNQKKEMSICFCNYPEDSSSFYNLYGTKEEDQIPYNILNKIDEKSPSRFYEDDSFESYDGEIHFKLEEDNKFSISCKYTPSYSSSDETVINIDLSENKTPLALLIKKINDIAMEYAEEKYFKNDVIPNNEIKSSLKI